ncbi:MAG TPA: galactokinase [Polyangiaceae bacterium]|nr:galactokinase [Polyangiaceae bacterium]
MTWGTHSYGLERVAIDATRAFSDRFGRAPAWLVAAPGRINLIGEHTDYNGGYVLPMTIDRYVVIAASPAAALHGRRMTIHSESLGSTADIGLDAEVGRGAPAWSNYVRGVLAGFQKRLAERRLEIPAVDALIASNLPRGGGLSSSAALEVATANLLELVTGLRLASLEKALMCQTAEHDYAGVPCGLMDQLVCVQGDARGPLLIDCRAQVARRVPLDDGVTVLISNTGIRHALADGAYAQRRAECEAAARRLGVACLREADVDTVEGARQILGPVGHRRARHVVTENARTVRAAELLEVGDLDGVGALMYESHCSLRDDYEVSCPELDVLVDAAREIGSAAGVYGARMTGGGFGGCAITLLRTNPVEAVARELERRFERFTGRSLDAFVSRPADGGGRLDPGRFGIGAS